MHATNPLGLYERRGSLFIVIFARSLRVVLPVIVSGNVLYIHSTTAMVRRRILRRVLNMTKSIMRIDDCVGSLEHCVAVPVYMFH